MEETQPKAREAEPIKMRVKRAVIEGLERTAFEAGVYAHPSGLLLLGGGWEFDSDGSSAHGLAPAVFAVWQSRRAPQLVPESSPDPLAALTARVQLVIRSLELCRTVFVGMADEGDICAKAAVNAYGDAIDSLQSALDAPDSQ